MRKFHVEDRNAGIIVLTGSIGSDGSPSVKDMHPSFNSALAKDIISAIHKDLMEGYSGGQLPERGLEWFELTK
jgi:hypothetical protein